VQRRRVHDRIHLPESPQNLRLVSNICPDRLVRGVKVAAIHQDGLIACLLERRGEDPTQVAPASGDKHPHAAKPPSFLEWRDFVDELDLLLGEEGAHGCRRVRLDLLGRLGPGDRH
jgi:hypothetical protein